MNQPNCPAEPARIDRVKPSGWWAAHFRGNRHRDWAIPWQVPEPLPAAALARIASSIAEFQRGESSEARTYLAKSELFSARTGDPAFHATSLLFVREENGHAALLLRFMQLAGIPPNRKSYGDRVFRALRAASDMGWASRVLIIAELIAQEYYPCLQAATDHPVLRRICDKVIFDEEAHICFQVERIVRVEASRGAAGIALRDLLQTVLMAGAALVVYRGHRGVLASRLGFAAFFSRAMLRNRQAILAMRLLRLGRPSGKARAAGLDHLSGAEA